MGSWAHIIGIVAVESVGWNMYPNSTPNHQRNQECQRLEKHFEKSLKKHSFDLPDHLITITVTQGSRGPLIAIHGDLEGYDSEEDKEQLTDIIVEMLTASLKINQMCFAREAAIRITLNNQESTATEIRNSQEIDQPFIINHRHGKDRIGATQSTN